LVIDPKSNAEYLSDWNYYYDVISCKGIYHCPAYIKALESHYECPAELFVFKADKNNFIYYPYFRRSLKKLPFSQFFENNLRNYYDIESSWYYGGPLIQTDGSKSLEEFIESFTTTFSKYCKETKIISEFIRFDPNLKNHLFFKGRLPITRNRETVYLDLKRSKEEIWNNFEGRTRTAIRKALKLGVKIHFSKKSNSELKKFFQIYSNEMIRKNAPRHYRLRYDFINSLFEYINKQILLVYAEVNGIFISAGLFVYDLERAVHYYLMATLKEYQKYQANNLLLYEAMLYFKNRGVPVFDLQGGREGVYNFKKSFSKDRASFYTAGVVHNRSVYNELARYKDKYVGSDTSDFFPQYRLKETN